METIKTGLTVCSLIGSAINNLPFEMELPDLKEMIFFAQKHNMLDNLFFALEKINYSQAELEPYINKYKNLTFDQTKITSIKNSISDKLSENKIKHIFLNDDKKDENNIEFIDNFSTDIDLYIDNGDKEKIEEILENMDFQKIFYDEKDEIETYFKKPNCNLQLYHLLKVEGSTKPQRDYLKELMQKAVCVKDYKYTLINEDLYVCRLLHLYKYFLHYAVDVKMFFDIYIYQKNLNLDIEKVETILKGIDTFKFYSSVKRLCDVFFENKNLAKSDEDTIKYIFDCATENAKDETSVKNSTFDYINNLVRKIINKPDISENKRTTLEIEIIMQNMGIKIRHRNNVSIKCQIVRDLIASFENKKISQGSKEFVLEHCDSCDECNNILLSANKQVDLYDQGWVNPDLYDEYKKSMDNLKKRDLKRNIITVIATFLIMLIFFSAINIKRYGTIIFTNVDYNVSSQFAERSKEHPSYKDVKSSMDVIKTDFSILGAGSILLGLKYNDEYTFNKEAGFGNKIVVDVAYYRVFKEKNDKFLFYSNEYSYVMVYNSYFQDWQIENLVKIEK